MKKSIKTYLEFDVVNATCIDESLYGIVCYDSLNKEVTLMCRDDYSWFFLTEEEMKDYNIRTLGSLFEEKHIEFKEEIFNTLHNLRNF